MGEKLYFVAIPTPPVPVPEGNSRSRVITDQETGVKYPLADYQLLPNMSIVDTDNMMSRKGLIQCIECGCSDSCTGGICFPLWQPGLY